MNTCRTCKYWGRNGNMIGAGICINCDVSMKVNIGNHGFYTSQNFGCVDHCEGEPIANVLSKPENYRILAEFMRDECK